MKQHEIVALANSLNAQVIETHISWVLLTNNYAYKIKKPLKTSFLDFSNLSLREFYCEEELRLNKEFTEDVYLKVVPILNQNSKIKLSGDGVIVDYALKMKKLDPNRQLSILLNTNKIKIEEIKKLGILIAAIHQKAKPIQVVDKVPVLAHEFEDLILEIEKSSLISAIDKNEITESVFFADNFLAQYQNTFTQREKSGMLKEVHGDLHSENIFITNPIVIFDRIEFNKSFRTIDILHEIAYLCTDLDFYERPDLSYLLLKTYLQETGIKFTLTEKKIFYFYKAYAANVRGKVKLLLTGQKGKEGKKYIQQFKKYFELMKSYIKVLD